MMADHDFQKRSEEALADLYRRLSKAAEEHSFEADFHAGALIIEFDDPPAKFVVSPNSPVRQIWVSAHSKSYKLDWDAARGVFATGGQTLPELIGDAVSRQLGATVKL